MKRVNAYKKTQIATSDPMDILVALYDGLLSHLTAAEIALEGGDRAQAGNRLSRSVAIICELQACVDHRADATFGAQLEALYTWFIQEITQANLKRDPQRLPPVKRMVEDLRDAWKQAAQEVRGKGHFASAG